MRRILSPCFELREGSKGIGVGVGKGKEGENGWGGEVTQENLMVVNGIESFCRIWFVE